MQVSNHMPKRGLTRAWPVWTRTTYQPITWYITVEKEDSQGCCRRTVVYTAGIKHNIILVHYVVCVPFCRVGHVWFLIVLCGVTVH